MSIVFYWSTDTVIMFPLMGDHAVTYQLEERLYLYYQIKFKIAVSILSNYTVQRGVLAEASKHVIGSDILLLR